jgi:hypothetical protein
VRRRLGWSTAELTHHNDDRPAVARHRLLPRAD